MSGTVKYCHAPSSNPVTGSRVISRRNRRFPEVTLRSPRPSAPDAILLPLPFARICPVPLPGPPRSTHTTAAIEPVPACLNADKRAQGSEYATVAALPDAYAERCVGRGVAHEHARSNQQHGDQSTDGLQPCEATVLKSGHGLARETGPMGELLSREASDPPPPR